MKIKKGDKVMVMVGKDKGKEGVVEKTYVNSKKILIAGVNLYKRHMRKSQDLPQGGIIELPRALHISKIAALDPKTKKPTKIGYKMEDGKKVRFAKNSGTVLKN